VKLLGETAAKDIPVQYFHPFLKKSQNNLNLYKLKIYFYRPNLLL
jgi:hypothetical protein